MKKIFIASRRTPTSSQDLSIFVQNKKFIFLIEYEFFKDNSWYGSSKKELYALHNQVTVEFLAELLEGKEPKSEAFNTFVNSIFDQYA